MPINQNSFQGIPYIVPVNSGALTGSSTNNQVTAQVQNAKPFVITQISMTSTGAYEFNWRINGGDTLYFSDFVKSAALFLGYLPYTLAKPVVVPFGTNQIIATINELSGSSNTIQLIFMGYQQF